MEPTVNSNPLDKSVAMPRLELSDDEERSPLLRALSEHFLKYYVVFDPRNLLASPTTKLGEGG